ncbi:MmgE/PrpD family protein [Agrobacterium rhizogenes]|uniref:MmgE/PrpD family protein n=1 Tax=Rhizobium rhizogenes TaxID=359 RepID=UPI00115EB646|nr:MmgE/PrpD family protein [Rhizobium rhizogenes]KAA6486164.1 MmgE/PrpD family protein [Agrobacterium sp. ICMP 7243]NTF50623.1 MmgE/PrpD family protein [Rhizobium rhizogenes]NTF63679.1 MmgE/PrpD family protein [Rhizobium rhizogenes]NTG02610.1 MmgE/PrpD family protein [Rhizobium rhizogenes]NTG09675.1 MmgE/PrpD family protein [Rhizobium rhizogenes]
MTLTSRIAAFAETLRYDDIPQAVRHKASLHIIDSIGCGIAGAASDLSRRVLSFLASEAKEGVCPILGTPLAFGPATSAFGNSAAMNALDFDDGLEVDGKGMGHPGATIVAAAIAAPFLAVISGRDFLTAVVAGYEINNRLIQAIQPSMERFREVYGVCQHQTVGAAIAYGKQKGLGRDALENAIGFAGTLANVPSLKKYNWESRPLVSFKDFNAPAAETGVRAVELDACGLVGAKAVLDGTSGLWRMLGSDRFDEEILVGGLGDDWSLSGNTIKAFPTCRWMQTTLSAFQELKREHGLRAGDIQTVTVHTASALIRDFMDRAPTTMVDAQFSFPYALAAMALDIAPAARWYEPETMTHADLKAFSSRVEVEIDDEADRLLDSIRRPTGRVSIRTKDGRHLASPLVQFAPGSPLNPVSDDFILEKFEANVVPVIGTEASQKLLEGLFGLDRIGDMAALLWLGVTAN